MYSAPTRSVRMLAAMPLIAMLPERLRRFGDGAPWPTGGRLAQNGRGAARATHPGECLRAQQSALRQRLPQGWIAEYAEDRSGNIARLRRIAKQGCTAGDFRHRRGVRGDDRSAAGHGFDEWHAEALDRRRADKGD